MSDQNLRWKWKLAVRVDARFTAAQRFVALIIGDTAKPDGTGFFMGQARLAKEFHLSRDTVAGAYKKLEQRGYLARLDTKQGRASRYELSIPE